MARYMRQYGQSDLRPPTVVGAGIAWHGPGVYLAYPGFVQDRECRRKAKYVLRPPRVVTPAPTQIFFGPKVYLNVMLPERQRSTVTRRRPTYAIGPPAVLRTNGPSQYVLAYSRRGRAKSFLLPPRVPPAEPFPDCGYPITDNFNRANQNPIGPPWDTTLLGPLNYAQILSNELAPVAGGGGVEGYAVYGRPVLPGDFEVIVTLPNGLSGSDAVEFSLATEGTFFVTFGNNSGDPRVTFSSPTSDLVQVTTFQAGCKIGVRRIGTFFEAWRQQPGGNWERLAVVSGADATLSDYFYLRIIGASASAVVIDDFSLCPTVHAPVAVTSTYAKRGRPKSFLRPPVVVLSGLLPSGPQVTLARIRPPAVYPTYVYPIVVNAPTEAWGYIGIQLVQRPRPKTRSFLRPAVLLVAAQTYYGPSVHYVRGRRPVAKSRLRPPSILASSGPSQYVLAYSRRGRPRSFLRPPTDTVGLEDQGRVRTHLAYSRHGRPISELRPPVVVFLAVEIYGPEVHLTRIKPPPTLAFLRPPTDVVDQQDLGLVRVHLAYSRRGEPLFHLSPPAVVSPVLFFGPAVELAPSSRGTPKSRLRPAAVVSQPPAYQQVIPPVLTYSRRGRPVFFLNPPTVVFPFFARRVDVILAPQIRGRPTSFLSPPAILRERGALLITLAPQRRGKAKPFLRPPVVVRLAVEIYGPETQLAYSRRGRPQSRLEPPTVVGQRPFRGLLVHLTYSRRGKATSFRQPEAIGQRPGRPIAVHLTRIRPRRTLHFLRPAEVVRIPAFGQVNVHLARIKHPPVFSLLKPPTVVGAGVAFYGPAVHLVRIRPPRVIHALRVTLVAFRRPQGDVCGFDVAGSFVCELQVPVGKVSGSDAAGSAVTGTSRAANTVTGSDSAGGSVSGTDRKAT